MDPHKPLALPPLFDARNVEQYHYGPDQTRVFVEASEWRRAHNLAPSAADKRNIHLLLIDVQKDFCFPKGSLYVGGRSGRGALDDGRRTAEFIYRNLDVITNITTTMDTHFAFQIFFASFWVDKNGQAPTPFREITTDDIDRGELQPNLHEARLFHSYARGAQSWVEVKGGNALTENYSVLRPEVLMRHDGQPLAQRNTTFIKTLLTADAVIIAGQAASHCVKSSIDDLLDEIVSQDKALASKVYVLSDCMSSVTVPDGKGGFVADFTPQAEQALARFSDAGMHVVRSTDPIEAWPGLHLS